MDLFIFKLAILLTPGFFSLHIIKSLSDLPLIERRTLSTYDFFLILFFSLICASVFDLIAKIFHLSTVMTIFLWITDFDGNLDSSFTMVTFIILGTIALLVGLVVSWVNTKHIFYRLMTKLKISSIYGREDIWCNFTTNLSKGQWVIVRDFLNKYIYVGSIYLVSETYEKRELVLSDVKVYKLNETEEMLFEAQFMYIPLIENFTIEIAESCS